MNDYTHVAPRRFTAKALILALLLTSIFALPLGAPIPAEAANAAPAVTAETTASEVATLPTENDYLADVYGLPANHVFENVTFERLKYILGYTASNGNNADNAGGNYAIVFGGPENASSQATVKLIDEVAKEYGVAKVYHFDPKLDGDRLDITSTNPAIISAFRDLWSGTNGLKNRLKNVDETYTSDSTWLFVYNKTRTEDAVSAPIVAGLVSKASSLGSTQAANYKQRVADVFEAAGVDAQSNKADIAVYPFFDYFRTRINTTVGTNNTYQKVWIPETARADFAIQTITYPQLLHILESEGDYAIFLGGTWCPYTSPTDNIANTAALAAGVKKVYQFDLRLDGNSSATSLKTALKSADPDVSATVLEGGDLYGTLVEKLSNLRLEPDVNQYLYYPKGDFSKEKKAAPSIGVPFLFEYNRDNKDAQGNPAPVVSEWIGYKPVSDELYAYAWYTKNDVRDWLNDPAYREKQLGRPVNPDVDDVIGNGANSATLALPGLYSFFAGLSDNRNAVNPWAYTPGSRPADSSAPTATGGCGAEAKEIELEVENPILGQNGNAGYDAKNYNINAVYTEPLGDLPGNIRVDTTIAARATQSLSAVAFDLQNLNITKVTVNGQAATYTQQNDDATDTHKIIVTPAASIASGSDFTVDISYWTRTGTYKFNGDSTQGLVPSANSSGATVIGEPNGPTFWFPSNNNTTDRATYDIKLTAPRNLTGVSVGKLVSRTINGTWATRQWKQSQETIPYLVDASFGDYLEFEQEITLTDGTKIPAWAYVDESLYNKNAANRNKVYYYAKELPDYIRWAESRVGKYPGETAGFVFENLKDGENSVGYSLETVGRPYYSGIPDTATFVHEQLHQWFGDSVTIAKWEDLWLNEGFASFLSNIYFEDHDNLTTTTNDWYRQWFRDNTDSDFWYLAPADPWNVKNLFTDVTYGRGSYALAALRTAVGDTDFFNIIRGWAATYAGKSATTANFIALAKDTAAVDETALGTFLQEWLYTQYKPSLFPAGQLAAKDPGNGGGNNNDGDNDGGNGGNNNGGDNSGGNGGNNNGNNGDPTNPGDNNANPSGNGDADTVLTLAAAKIAKITDRPYTGKALKPAVSVTLNGKTLRAGTDYTVEYGANRNIGTAKVTVTGKGAYSGTVTAGFKIVPARAAVRQVKAGAGMFTITWQAVLKATKQQIRYRAWGTAAWKTVTVPAKATSRAISKLKKGKKYEVAVRAYRTASGAKYYGAWSSTKIVKVK